ncbi:hypothetical protein DPMN_151878 [Dreissena polymorpha]|uniref:Uncharacterized protein n=1 Tax=Dreissena polymorpha TaxID=45954 RepID=A0A9D4FKD0_DREPO|nr:hypothetical protein DPMN_151878 [Dreissena polymorpha]
MSFAGCNSDGCLQMAEDNCKTAPKACFLCPCKYCWYATKHCLAVLDEILREQQKQPKTANDIVFDMQMQEEDKICQDKHVGGCFFCPCFLSAAALGFVGMVMTWLGSASCYIAGCCCKSCKNNKVANSPDIENN